MENTFFFFGNETIGETLTRFSANAAWQRVDSLAEASVLVTYCSSQQRLEDAYFGDGGFVQTAQPQTILLDLSPSSPGFSRELSAVAMVSDLRPVEAPLVVLDPSRADAFSRPDNLMCFVAGEEDDVEAASLLLEAFVGQVKVEGVLGSAQLARAACTIQQVSNMVAAAEAQALCYAVRRSFGASTLAEKAPYPENDLVAACLKAIAQKQFEGSYTLEMMMGELSAALMAADDADLILPQTEACMHLLELLAVIGGSDKSPLALSLVYGEEKECADQGLDWSRAEEMYGNTDEEGFGQGYAPAFFDRGEDFDFDSDYDEDFDDFDSFNNYERGFRGGFGSYSPN